MGSARHLCLQRGGGLVAWVRSWEPRFSLPTFTTPGRTQGEKPERSPDGTVLIGETRWTMRKELLYLFISWPTQNISSVFSEDNTNTRFFFKLGNKSHEKDNVGWKNLILWDPSGLSTIWSKKGWVMIASCYRLSLQEASSMWCIGRQEWESQRHIPAAPSKSCTLWSVPVYSISPLI